MEKRYSTHPDHVKTFNTEQLRQHFLIEKLFINGETKLVYSMEDRTIVGGVTPTTDAIVLEENDELKADYFLERREVGIINVGNSGKVTVDGQEYKMKKKDCLYVGKGQKNLVFSSDSASEPAKYYLFSAPAHKEYPVQKVSLNDFEGDQLGSPESANERVLTRMIHDNGIQSCQIVMGMTQLKPGSVWNSMPTHTHDRRMEVYLYIDLDENARMFHMMGQPNETRHLVMKNEQAVISPPWSIHCGSATSNYTFVWAMAGENKQFTDMDHVKMEELR
ncbi:5-dehydro-4-deoxy-D-glucuronate isomerase [Evansella tamaricis]|uniref:4-deoxy-L-threo-5-hexosulose-uronate ketol-isomerase n=1 Tax=Evansella tamaricis TaxID=2069301 RepID=A0ABS6JD83_9BACI|nr:5-dehydro-4-deoxy-D-glucuronate isomerase [Evansella tamaricis]MBU9711634.1 5-dehydro-4-deoxy-D-glucuronate isomerase [Evansella tamaricis]